MPWLMRASSRLARDERGIALPMALLALLILATLVISFVLLATSEPLIATNQKLVAQARALAESGIERAIWALNNPTDPNGLPNPLPGLAPNLREAWWETGRTFYLEGRAEGGKDARRFPSDGFDFAAG